MRDSKRNKSSKRRIRKSRRKKEKKGEKCSSRVTCRVVLVKEGVEGSSSGGRLYPTNKSSNIQVARSLRTHPGASSDGTALFLLLGSMITGRGTALWGPM